MSLFEACDSHSTSSKFTATHMHIYYSLNTAYILVTYSIYKCFVLLCTIFLFNVHLNKILRNPVGFFLSLPLSFPIPSFLSSPFYPSSLLLFLPSSSSTLDHSWCCWTPCSLSGQVFSSCALPHSPASPYARTTSRLWM